MNFGPLTAEFAVMVWRLFMRQMREIVETRSILCMQTHIRQWMAGTAERICAKFTRKTCLVLRSDDLECHLSKVKGQGHQGQNNALCTQNTPAVWTEWNTLVTDNVAQAAARRDDSIAAEGCPRRPT